MVATGCGATKPPAGIMELLVSPTEFSIARHDTLRLHTTVLNDVGETLTGVAVTFHSNNTGIATVDAFGLVRSVGPLGSTTITVSAAGLEKTVSVTVFGVPGVFTLTPLDTFVFQGGSVQLTATLLDSGGIVIPGATVTYATTGPISVSSTALVTSLGPAGEASVTASANFSPYVVTSKIHVLDTALAGRVTAVGHPAAVAISRTGTALVTRELAVYLTRIDLPSVSVAAQVRVPWGLSAVAFDTTGGRAYALDPTGKVHVIDLGANLDVDSFPTNGVPLAIGVTRDNLQLLLATGADSLFRYDRAGLAEVSAVATPAPVTAIVRHPSSVALVYLSLPDSGLVLEYDLAGDSVRRRLPLGGAPARLALAPDASRLYAADRTAASVHVWDLVANADIATVSVGVPPADIDLSPDGARIWISARAQGQVKEIDAVTRAVVRTVTTGGAPRGLAVSRLDGTAVVANDSGWVDIIKP